MSRRNPRKLLALVALVGVIGALAAAAPFAINAGAQPTVAPDVSLAVDMSDDGTEATVTLMLDPGSETVAALDGVISYNPDHATPTSCSDLDGFGACNPESAGVVRFASASAENWTEATDVLAVTFTVSDTSEVGLSLGAVYSPANEELAEVTVGDPVTLGQATAPAGSGALTGTILAGDAALFGTQVCAESGQTDVSVCADADSRGGYRIEGLATGSYTVTARHYSGEYATLTLTDVGVISPNLTQGVDGVLGSAADAAEGQDDEASTTDSSSPASGLGDNSVSGIATDSAGAPVPAALVCIEDPAIGRPSCSGTGFDGTYEIGDLIGGNYVVTITDPGGRYGDQTGPSFGLNIDQHRTGVDFTLTAG